MHVGRAVFFQNLDGRRDRDVYTSELTLALECEALGFQSIWLAEHHFSGYHMCPNVVQLLTYIAARTTTARLGSMVVVLPWHEPVRAAEELAVLDNLSGGRLILGLGRGLGRIEFDGFRIPMADSRGRFLEYSEAIVDAFDTGVLSYEGRYYQQPPVMIRPAPLAPLRGRVYASAVSPESMEIMARLGFGVMLNAQKPWAVIEKELGVYRDFFVDKNGCAPPGPLLVTHTVVDESEARARELFEEHVLGYMKSALVHYEFDNRDLAKVPGYEYYGKMADAIAAEGPEASVRMLADLQSWGTPEQVVEQITEHVRQLDGAGVIAALSFGGMDDGEARRNQELFARTVLPRLRKIDPQREISGPLELVN